MQTKKEVPQCYILLENIMFLYFTSENITFWKYTLDFTNIFLYQINFINLLITKTITKYSFLTLVMLNK